MRTKTLLFLLTLATTSTYTRHAMALDYQVSFCFYVDPSTFSDVDSAIGDDFWDDPSSLELAKGLLFKIIRNSDDHEVIYSYLSSGCTNSLTVSSTETYTIRVFSKAIDDSDFNYIVVQDDDINNAKYYWDIETSWVPQFYGYEHITIPTFHQFAITAVAAFAMRRHDAGLSGETFDIYYEPTPAPTNSFQNSGDVFLSNQGRLNKRTVVHELGHAIAHILNGVGPRFSYDAAPSGNCPGQNGNHWAISVEYQSAAVVEGLAQFYAAATFNSTAESDCYMTRNGGATTDWDRDGTPDGSIYSCEGAPVPGTADAFDYYGDWCLGADNDNRAVEYDWHRFFWDLTVDQSVPVNDIFDIYDNASPSTWFKTGDGTGSFYPSTRMRNAANSLGYLTEWDAEDNKNGVHR